MFTGRADPFSYNVTVMIKLIALDRCPVGRGVFVECRGRELAVFRPATGGDEVFVTENACPHSSGNLSGGLLDGVEVTCRSHDRRFDLRSGSCVDSPKARIVRYPVQVRGGDVYIDLDRPLT